MIAYFDCFSGISGDMILGALVDLGVPASYLSEQISRLPLEGFSIKVTRESRMGIHGSRVRVLVDDDPHARDYRAIRSLLEASSLPESVKGSGLKIFERLAEVESRIHNCPKECVHFHELGGVDTIVDVLGAILALEWLGIKKVYASKIPLGNGFVACHHGRLPVPAPATLALLRGVPVYGSDIQQEIVTPTGAAIITTLAEGFGTMPEMRVENVGYGAGSKVFTELPNLLRVVLGKVETRLESDSVVIIETNIDDLNPEIYGFVMDRLFEEGALDVALLPIFMKKNRPGTMIRAICTESNSKNVIRRILSETTATGVRYYHADRIKLLREVKDVITPYGKIRVKCITDISGDVHFVPEYEDCKRIALSKKVPLKRVYEAVIKAGKE
nr:nickel pincer cofactor biosynthesis protein LarC [Desulfobacterales bacterium]